MDKVTFVKQIYPMILKQCRIHGYHTNVISGMIAQAIHEGYNSGLAIKYFNYWGMKAGRGYKGDTIKMNNKAGTDPATYRVFSSMEDGVKGYFKFLSASRYKPCKNATTPQEFLRSVAACGWNSNKDYPSHCCTHIAEVTQIIMNAFNNDHVQFYPQYTGSSISIVIALAAVGETDTSFKHRKQIATLNGVENYTGTATQNMQLVNCLKRGCLIK